MADRKINIDQVCSYLNHAFGKARQKAVQNLKSPKNHKGTVLYDYEVDFAYLIDSIQRGPTYIAPKLISTANELIADLETATE